MHVRKGIPKTRKEKGLWCKKDRRGIVLGSTRVGERD